jgi:hypothetical protein
MISAIILVGPSSTNALILVGPSSTNAIGDHQYFPARIRFLNANFYTIIFLQPDTGREILMVTDCIGR